MRSVALFLIPAFAFFACSDEGNSGQVGVTDGGPRAEADRLVLPFVVSQQGPLQDQGQEQRRGALVAVQQLNSLGGILGRQVRVEFLEDSSDPAIAAGLIPRITEIASPIVLGPTGSPAASALRQALPDQLFISPSATSPVLDVVADGGVPAESSFFRTAPSDTLLAKALSLLASVGDRTPTAQVCASLSIVNSDDDYGRPIADRVEFLYKLGASPISKRTPISGTLQAPDAYEDVASGIVAAEENCQLVIAPAEIGAEYVRAFRRVQSRQPDRDWTTFQTIGANALRTEAFLRSSRQDPAVEDSPSLAEGVQLVAAETEPEGTNYSAYKTMYLAQFPTEPIGRSANAYDAVILAALSLEAAGVGADGVKVRQSLRNISQLGTAYGPAKLGDALLEIRRGVDIDYVGASGSLDFNQQGQVLSDFLVWQVKSGKFENISRFVDSEVQ